MKEIITLQFGNFSNYVGAHWVNIQEAGLSYNPCFVPDIDSKLSFREGQTLHSGECTYTPRLILMDLDGSLGYLPETGGVYEEDSGDIAPIENSETIITHKKPPYEKNEFLLDMERLIKAKKTGHDSGAYLKSGYNLTGSINSWTDFLVQRLHPRSITIVPGQYQWPSKLSDEAPPFISFGTGIEAWQNIIFSENYIDKLQKYLEECDSVQGFQTIVDVTDGFAGLSVEIHEYLSDEYSKKAIFSCLPTFHEKNPSSSKISLAFRSVNTAYALSHFSDCVDLILPISTSTDLSYNSTVRKINDVSLLESDKYQHSAILAAALDVITMPYRMRTNDITMRDYISQVCVHGRRICSGSIRFPFPLRNNEYLLPLLEQWEGPLLTSLTPCVEDELFDDSIQYINSKGLMNNFLVPNAVKDASNPAHKCQTASQMISLFYKFLSSSSNITHSVSTQDTFRVPVTYPDILNKEYNLVPEDSSIVGRLAEFRILAGLHCSTKVKSYIEHAVEACSTNKIKCVFHDIDPPEFLTALERLTSFAESYTNSWHL